jgi:hypothetical protein
LGNLIDFGKILLKLVFWSRKVKGTGNEMVNRKEKLYANSLDSNELLKYGIKVSITNYCECLKFRGCEFS